MRDPDQIYHQSHEVKLFDVANQDHCYIVNSLRTWEYPIGDPVQFLNCISHGNEVACFCDQRLFFLFGDLRLVNAASLRNIDQEKIFSGTQGNASLNFSHLLLSLSMNILVCLKDNVFKTTYPLPFEGQMVRLLRISWSAI